MSVDLEYAILSGVAAKMGWKFEPHRVNETVDDRGGKSERRWALSVPLSRTTMYVGVLGQSTLVVYNDWGNISFHQSVLAEADLNDPKSLTVGNLRAMLKDADRMERMEEQLAFLSVTKRNRR